MNNIFLNPFWLLQRVTCFFWPVVAGIASLVGAGVSLFGAATAASEQRKAGRLQAEQVMANARAQSENVFRQAEELAYKNQLAIEALRLEQEKSVYDFTYMMDQLVYKTDTEIINLQRGIQYTDFDIEGLQRATAMQIDEARTQAGIYGAKAGLERYKAEYYRGIYANTEKEIDLVRVLGELDLRDIAESAKSAVRELNFRAEEAALDAKAVRASSRENLANALAIIETGKRGIETERRGNARTLAVIRAKLSATRQLSGSSKDIVKDVQREQQQTEADKVFSYKIEANSQVAMSLAKKFTAQMKEAEATFLSGKVSEVVSAAQRQTQKSAANFAITNIGYQNKLAGIQVNIQESLVSAAIYGAQAGLASRTAGYLRDASDLKLRELLFKRSTYEEDIIRQRSLATLDLDRLNTLFDFSSRENSFKINNLQQETARAREEARYLSEQYLEAGRRGYSLTLQQSSSQATSYMMQGVGGFLSNVAGAATSFAQR